MNESCREIKQLCLKFGVWNLSSYAAQGARSELLSCTLTSFTTKESLCARCNFTLEDNGAACSSVLELHYFFTPVIHALNHTLLAREYTHNERKKERKKE